MLENKVNADNHRSFKGYAAVKKEASKAKPHYAES